MPAEIPVSLATAFLLGVSLGLTACAVTCLPFIGTLVFGKAAGRRSGMIDAACFLGGRLIAYTLLGALAGLMGAWFFKVLADGLGNLVIGLAAIISAALLFGESAGPTGHACGRQEILAKFSPFFLGFALTLIPCAPLATLLATAAGGESLLRGAELGFAFGLGALLTPMLVLIPAGASIAGKLRDDQPWLANAMRLGASVVLALIGCRRIAGADTELGWFALFVCLIGGILLWRKRRQRQLRVDSRQVIVVHPVTR